MLKIRRFRLKAPLLLFWSKMLKMYFSCYKGYIKRDAPPFWVALEYCGQNKQKRRFVLENALLQNEKMTFETKMPTIGFYPKSENVGQMCNCVCRPIVKLESGGQHHTEKSLLK